MFNRLRLRLTVLYLGAAVALVAILVGATYVLVNYYFESSVNLTMERRMAHEFRERQLPLPPKLAQADSSTPLSQPTQKDSLPVLDASTVYADEVAADELAAITVWMLDRNGKILAPDDGPAATRLASTRRGCRSCTGQ